MTKRILLINPPIYDFSAYDFWLKPYGLLRVGGYLRDSAELELFDFLDRYHPLVHWKGKRGDEWGRGKYISKRVDKPGIFSHIPRVYRRYGISGEDFRSFLLSRAPFDAALIQTNMTYWYQGVQEVLEILREVNPRTRSVLGGTYATLCPDHARFLGADLVVEGCHLTPLWHYLDLDADESQIPFWEGYQKPVAGVLKLTNGCPFRCTYCSVPQIAPRFEPFELERSWDAFRFLTQLGTPNIVFYDDALLFQADQVLKPFLSRVLETGFQGSFHTPNALNARFLNPDMAKLLVHAGFRLFYLGFESSALSWQQSTGGKVTPSEFEQAVSHLKQAGARPDQITAYLIVGHPETESQEIEESMRTVHSLGVRIMLSEYSPIPGTPDGEECRRWLDLDEPLLHNKTAFTLSFLGKRRLQQLKDLSSEMNSELS
jgi:radical SAM superfamily enzyme YgiQ (UPF0313 family)